MMKKNKVVATHGNHDEEDQYHFRYPTEHQGEVEVEEEEEEVNPLQHSQPQPQPQPQPHFIFNNNNDNNNNNNNVVVVSSPPYNNNNKKNNNMRRGSNSNSEMMRKQQQQQGGGGGGVGVIIPSTPITNNNNNNNNPNSPYVGSSSNDVQNQRLSDSNNNNNNGGSPKKGNRRSSASNNNININNNIGRSSMSNDGEEKKKKGRKLRRGSSDLPYDPNAKPRDPLGKLMYYLHCAQLCVSNDKNINNNNKNNNNHIEMKVAANNNQGEEEEEVKIEMGSLCPVLVTQYQRANHLDDDEFADMKNLVLQWIANYPPNQLYGKLFFFEDIHKDLLAPGQFLSISIAERKFGASRYVDLHGIRHEVKQVMCFSDGWIQEYFIDPFKAITAGPSSQRMVSDEDFQGRNLQQWTKRYKKTAQWKLILYVVNTMVFLGGISLLATSGYAFGTDGVPRALITFMFVLGCGSVLLSFLGIYGARVADAKVHHDERNWWLIIYCVIFLLLAIAQVIGFIMFFAARHTAVSTLDTTATRLAQANPKNWLQLQQTFKCCGWVKNNESIATNCGSPSSPIQSPTNPPPCREVWGNAVGKSLAMVGTAGVVLFITEILVIVASCCLTFFVSYCQEIMQKQ